MNKHTVNEDGSVSLAVATPKPRSHILRQWEGRLTRELLLEPAGHGLGMLPASDQPTATTTATCGFCATGCGLDIHLKDGQAIGLTPRTQYPVNLGMACPKGWEALRVLDAPNRATQPLLRGSDGKLQSTDWDTAMRAFADRFKTITQQHGPESLAYLSTGQIPTEEMALLGAVAKFGMGMKHGDGNTRQCMATAVVAYKQSFGFDAPPYTYQDFEESDTIVLVGSNLCIAHPIMWERIVRNRHDPRIIVVDPRKTETAMAATHHLPIAPKSDLVLFYGLARALIHQGWIDQAFIDAHTSGFEQMKAHVEPYTPDVVSETTGIDPEQLQEIARLIGTGKRVSFWWTMGVNQSYEGVRVAQAIINLALMTGNIGRPGTGANSITGQCNAMGSRLFSNTTNLLGGHDFGSPEHRQKVARILGIDQGLIQQEAGLAYDQIIEGVDAGRIKGLWMIATNGAHSWINQNDFERIIDKLDFFVVQDMYHDTESAQLADLVLPAAGWGEKQGTFINSERRIGLLKKVRRAPGQALADFAIFRLAAEYWGCGAMFERWASPESVFEIMQDLSAGQPCDITGIRGYADLDRSEGIQWPMPAQRAGQDRAPQRRLFADGNFYHPDGKAKFIVEAPRMMPEKPDERYPLMLLTGRGTASQWHTQTRTCQSPVLRKLYPESIYVEINPSNASEYGIEDGQAVTVESRRGKVTAEAFVTQTVQPGQVFLPMHYRRANRLTQSVFDPYSRQPSYKACAVRILPVADTEDRRP